MITTLGLAAGLLLTGAIATHTALAGTYVMRNCNVPGHGNSLLYPWQESERSYSDITTANGCASGSGFAARVGASRQLAYAHGVTIMLMKPPAPRSQIEFVKLMVWYGARLAGTGQPLHFRTSEYRSDGVLRVGLADTAPGSENVIAEHMLSPDTQSVHMSFQCGPWGVAQPEGCTAASHEPWLLRGVEVTLKEDVAPIVLAPTGSLLAGGPQSGSRTVTFSASDAQSGLRKVVVSLGATVVATHDLTPSCPHSDFTVCPASKDATLAIDTRTVANGSHRLTVRAEDAAGNISLVSADAPIDVANAPAAPAAVANAPAAPAPINALKHVLSARFKGTARSTLTVPYGRRVSVSGRLDQGSQLTPPGTLIEVLEKPDRRGAREVRRTRVKTKAGGSFSAVLATTRPSRRVRLAYRRADGTRIVSATLRLRVRAAARVRANLRGRVVRFSGRVLSGPVPKAGKRVQMEGRSPGSAWTVFKSLRTDRKGRFSGTYRLRVRRPGVTLKVRAVVRSEGGYGYLTSRSRAVKLRVR